MTGSLWLNTRVSVVYDSLNNPVRRNEYIDTAAALASYELYGYEPVEQLRVNPSPLSVPVTVYPNPTTGSFTLLFGSVPGSIITVSVINAGGQLVHSERFIPQQHAVNMNLGNEVAPGLYSILVYGSNHKLISGGTVVKR